MSRRSALLAVALLLPGCAFARPPLREPLRVVYKPPTGKPLADPPYPVMFYYRVELHNISNRPLRVVWFEGYLKIDGRWQGANVLGKTLRGREFSAWYTEGDVARGGVIPPGGAAACDPNWHGFDDPSMEVPMKWAFIAVDGAGNDYYVEGEVDPKVAMRKVAPAALEPEKP